MFSLLLNKAAGQHRGLGKIIGGNHCSRTTGRLGTVNFRIIEGGQMPLLPRGLQHIVVRGLVGGLQYEEIV